MKTASVFVALLTVSYGYLIPASNSGRIVGGEATVIENYPATVQLEFRSGTSWSQSCAANILTSRYVISAAHCFAAGAENNRRIRAGSSNRNNGGVVIEVERFINHPSYDSWTSDNDINLSYLVSPLTYSSTIQPATILAQGTVVPDNSVVTHAGWGTLYSGGPTPAVIHSVDIYKINSATCQARYSAHPLNWLYDFVITDGMICAGVLDVGGKDACQGDSGGPLYYFGNLYLVGIVSWGAGCAEALYPGVSANVAHYTNWIVENAV